MNRIYPEGFEVEEESTPLEINDRKRTLMIAKAKELLGDEPREEKDLTDMLEQYYVTEENEHYTSKQLKEIIEQVKTDLTPAVE